MNQYKRHTQFKENLYYLCNTNVKRFRQFFTNDVRSNNMALLFIVFKLHFQRILLKNKNGV